MSVSVGTSWRDDLVAAGRRLSAAMTAGLLAGAIFGGLGGRLAMFVLRLTSDAGLRGLETDDGFTIGVFSGATLFLVVITVIAGIIGGLVYLAVRPWFPERLRPWVFGSLAAAVGGAIVIRPEGIDFTLLEPLWLAVAMFIALPAAYGVVVSLVAERFLARGSAFGGSRVWIAGLVLLLPLPLFGPPGLLVLAAGLAGFMMSRSAPRIASLWTSLPVAWIGRAAIAAVILAAAAALVRDVTEIL